MKKRAAPEVLEAFTSADLSAGAAEQIAHFDKDVQGEVLKDILAGRPIGETIAAAKEKAAPDKPKDFRKKPTRKCSGGQPSNPIELSKVQTSWGYCVNNAIGLAEQTKRAVSSSAAEWRKLMSDLNHLIELAQGACEVVTERIEAIEEVGDEPDVNEVSEGYRDEQDADGFDFGDAPRPNPYEYGD